MFIKSVKIDAAHVTADTSFDATNIEPPMAPLDSALKTGLDTMLWRHDIIVSTRDATIFQRGAMSGRGEVLRHFKIKDFHESPRHFVKVLGLSAEWPRHFVNCLI